ncbi:hypothetical protein L208DRAFT_563526 [Tricholoma matsutake]|nr:hypothetical protein L208DRAFT_563526 [Tricholoma matsutake 945]
MYICLHPQLLGSRSCYPYHVSLNLARNHLPGSNFHHRSDSMDLIPALDPSGTNIVQDAVHISGITVLLDQPIEGIPSIKLVVNGVTFIKQQFEKGKQRLRLDFKPSFTLQNGSHLIIQLRKKKQLFGWAMLTECSLSFEDAQRILLSYDGNYHTLSDNPKITIDFATVSYNQGSNAHMYPTSLYSYGRTLIPCQRC